MSLPILYDFPASSASYRVRIGLALKGIAYRRVHIDLLKGDQRDAGYAARNPQGIVPTLEIDGHVIGQSLAILDYLDAKVREPRFVPRDAAPRARVLQKALAIACDIHPLPSLRVRRYLRDRLGASSEADGDWQRHWIAEGLRALEAMAAADGLPFLSGDAPGLADICLVPQLANARRAALDLAPYPTLVRIDEALRVLPPFIAAHPDRIAA